MARRSDQDSAADALYAKVPDIGCKGLCKASCGPINMSHRERTRIRQQTGIDIPPGSQMIKQGQLTCPALTGEGRCGAYRYRPMICRVWGASEDLPCRWGCQPADGERPLTGAETYQLLGAAMDAGGGCPDRSITAAAVEQAIADHGEIFFSSPAKDEYRRRGEEADYYREATQEIPAALVSDQVIGRYTAAFKAVAERNNRPYA
ncbi:YkgJ family cysteine cluster protein [Streptomyces solisilvae]|uniref:YkgJ family cysteine cluster protein n=1 Tax=Streptomyces malaysiensis TaxID=92644 RepID=UPI0036BA1B3B